MISATSIFLPTYFQVPNAFAMSLPGCCPTGSTALRHNFSQAKTCSLLHTETVFERCSCTSKTSAQTTLLMSIFPGVPRRYAFHDGLDVTSAEYLGDPDAIAAAIEGVAHQAAPLIIGPNTKTTCSSAQNELALRAHGYADGFNDQRRQAAQASSTFARARHRNGRLHSPFRCLAADHSLAQRK